MTRVLFGAKYLKRVRLRPHQASKAMETIYHYLSKWMSHLRGYSVDVCPGVVYFADSIFLKVQHLLLRQVIHLRTTASSNGYRTLSCANEQLKARSSQNINYLVVTNIFEHDQARYIILRSDVLYGFVR